MGGRGIWIWYLLRSTPTRMPSSMSVGAMRSPRPTTNLAICFTLMTYLSLLSALPMLKAWPKPPRAPSILSTALLPPSLFEVSASLFCAGMILVHRATCRGCSSLMRCLSAAMSHRSGGARPVWLSLTPIFSLTRFSASLISWSMRLSADAYGPWPYVRSSCISPSSRGTMASFLSASSPFFSYFSQSFLGAMANGDHAWTRVLPGTYAC